MTLLTTDEYRSLHPTALDEAALQLLLDAAEADIIEYVGPGGASMVEWFDGGHRIIALSRRAASITSIVENPPFGGGTPRTLDATDYIIDPTGVLLYRQTSGTNSRYTWDGRVVVTYATVDDEARRKVVQASLVYLTETYAPSLTSTTVGSWTEQYAQQADAHRGEYDAILARLVTHGRMAIVG